MISGRYRYLLDGVEVPVREEFVVRGAGRTDAEGARTTSWREAGDVRIDVDATWRGGALHAEVSWRSPALTRSRTFDGDEATSLFPLLRVFAGPVLIAVAGATQPADDGTVGGGRRVLVPDIRDPAATASLLAPLVDVRTAVVEHRRDGVTTLVYRGGSYAEAGARFDVDDDALLRGYTWEQPGVGRWEVDLVDVFREAG